MVLAIRLEESAAERRAALDDEERARRREAHELPRVWREELEGAVAEGEAARARRVDEDVEVDEARDLLAVDRQPARRAQRNGHAVDA